MLSFIAECEDLLEDERKADDTREDEKSDDLAAVPGVDNAAEVDAITAILKIARR